MLTASDHQVMLLVVHASCHYADEAKALQLRHVSKGNPYFHDSPSVDLRSSKLPVTYAIHGSRMRSGHASNGSHNEVGIPSHGETHSVTNGLSAGVREKRDIAHIDQMLAKGINVHLCPVGLWISL